MMVVASAPVLVAVALAIKLGDRGPVFFRQVRVGCDGALFTLFKFRTMVVDAEARLAELKSENARGGAPVQGFVRSPGNPHRSHSAGDQPRRAAAAASTCSTAR